MTKEVFRMKIPNRYLDEIHVVLARVTNDKYASIIQPLFDGDRRSSTNKLKDEGGKYDEKREKCSTKCVDIPLTTTREVIRK